MNYDKQSNSYSLTQKELSQLEKIYTLSCKLQDLIHKLPYYQEEIVDINNDYCPLKEALVSVNMGVNEVGVVFSKIVDNHIKELEHSIKTDNFIIK
jgi:hypothetical protein